MTNFIEFDENIRILKSISLESFSIEDLKENKINLSLEIDKTNKDIDKRINKRRSLEVF
tara:strand:+ start:365 stop:541 length:177 start_codon:yes stop_codon:yes gene_type:complete